MAGSAQLRARLIWRGVVAVALLMTLWLSGIGRADSASDGTGSWLDEPVASSWNQVAMDVPAAHSLSGSNPRCASVERWAETPEDQALVDAGWSLMAPYRAGWGLMVVDGAGGYDGMCRPLAYESFVFVDGQLAGTISPDPMNSRTTGAGSVIALRPDQVTARFLRYAPTDPLCCPSLGAVVVDYHVDRGPDGPVLTPFRSYREPDRSP
jgi:LppP/LprE lipoprotein